MTQKRKYDIGGNVIIEDDGRHLQAIHQRDDKSGSSIGVRRPLIGDMPPEVRVSISENGKLFYLLDYADMHGFWLGKDTFSVRESADIPKGFDYIAFDHPARNYGRIHLPFAFYSVRAKGETERWPTTDDAVQDYLLIAKREWDRNELRFNEVIKHTGRDLKWIIEKIGPWVPFPPESSPTVLG